ncbi:MAG: tRNA-dihydrouridine synthase family protein [Candidatus Methanomethylophilaceae archaeon]|nr:tRNA-dihydrouridine synthase family protein [Candidatus Methanomethylophilaceae archaeon]
MVPILMWKIGDLRIEGRVVLGPMSGITCRSYREFMKPFGVAVSVTEMTSDNGIIHGLQRSMTYVKFEHNYPTGLQLFGNDPDNLAKAAKNAILYNKNIDFFDINMGCPVSKVVNNGSGSALMDNPSKCGDIVRRIKETVNIPVTAKIRLGSNKNINFRQVIDELTDADVDAITIHARTREELYTGNPHFELVEDLQSDMSIPLIISGNVYSLNDAVRAVDITGASAVMVARGAVGNPYLITQIDHYYRTKETLSTPIISQQVNWCLSLADALIQEKGEELAINMLRGIAPKFIAGCRGCREYRHKLAVETIDLKNLTRLLYEIESEIGSEHIRT